MEKVIFFSGTHGAGKTTTIEKVRESNGFEIFSSSDGDHGNPYNDYFPRQVWRLNKYYLDSLEIFNKQEAIEKGKLLLADRCVFDHEAYTKAFHLLGWLKDSEYEKIEALRKVYFAEEKFHPRNVIFISPSEEWVRERIIKRWNEEKVKWNEGDFNYLNKLLEQYRKIMERESSKRDILVVRETDLEERVAAINHFIDRVKRKIT